MLFRPILANFKPHMRIERRISRMTAVRGCGEGLEWESIHSPKSDGQEGGNDGGLGCLHALCGTAAGGLLAAAIGQRMRKQIHKLFGHGRQLTLL